MRHGSYIYLASPYSHAEQRVMKARYRLACEAAAKLMGAGEVVFSPIAHSHPIAAHMEESAATDFNFWMKQDLPVLARASRLCVLTIPGWDVSKGVTLERMFAYGHGIPIEYLDTDCVRIERPPVEPEHWKWFKVDEMWAFR